MANSCDMRCRVEGPADAVAALWSQVDNTNSKCFDMPAHFVNARDKRLWLLRHPVGAETPEQQLKSETDYPNTLFAYADWSPKWDVWVKLSLEHPDLSFVVSWSVTDLWDAGTAVVCLGEVTFVAFDCGYFYWRREGGYPVHHWTLSLLNQSDATTTATLDDLHRRGLLSDYHDHHALDAVTRHAASVRTILEERGMAETDSEFAVQEQPRFELMAWGLCENTYLWSADTVAEHEWSSKNSNKKRWQEDDKLPVEGRARELVRASERPILLTAAELALVAADVRTDCGPHHDAPEYRPTFTQCEQRLVLQALAMLASGPERVPTAEELGFRPTPEMIRSLLRAYPAKPGEHSDMSARREQLEVALNSPAWASEIGFWPAWDHKRQDRLWNIVHQQPDANEPITTDATIRDLSEMRAE